MASLQNLLSLLLFTTLISCMTFTHAYSRKTINDLVTSTCKQTSDPKTCETALRSDPRSSTATTTEDLTLIMIDLAKVRFSDSLGYVQELTQKTKDPDVTRALKECIDTYKVVVNVLMPEAVSAVKLRNPKFGVDAMVDSGNEAEACLSGFPSGKVPSPLFGRTQILHGYADVAASLIRILL